MLCKLRSVFKFFFWVFWPNKNSLYTNKVTTKNALYHGLKSIILSITRKRKTPAGIIHIYSHCTWKVYGRENSGGRGSGGWCGGPVWGMRWVGLLYQGSKSDAQLAQIVLSQQPNSKPMLCCHCQWTVRLKCKCKSLLDITCGLETKKFWQI